MINYWGMGEDARIGVGKLLILLKVTGFEKNRTKTRCCNKVVYCCIGFCNMVCKCRRPPSVFSRIEYLRTKKHSDIMAHKRLSIIKELDMEETKFNTMEPLL